MAAGFLAIEFTVASFIARVIATLLVFLALALALLLAGQAVRVQTRSALGFWRRVLERCDNTPQQDLLFGQVFERTVFWRLWVGWLGWRRSVRSSKPCAKHQL